MKDHIVEVIWCALCLFQQSARSCQNMLEIARFPCKSSAVLWILLAFTPPKVRCVSCERIGVFDFGNDIVLSYYVSCTAGGCSIFKGICGRTLSGVRSYRPVSYTHLRAHETRHDLVCRLLLEKKKKTLYKTN